jgi:hypothetical protein
MCLIDINYGKGKLIMKNIVRSISSTRAILARKICLILLVACGIIIQDIQFAQANTTYIGAFTGRKVQAYMTEDNGNYSGVIAIKKNRFPFEGGNVKNGVLTGSYTDKEGKEVTFTISAKDDILSFVSEDTTESLKRLMLPKILPGIWESSKYSLDIQEKKGVYSGFIKVGDTKYPLTSGKVVAQQFKGKFSDGSQEKGFFITGEFEDLVMFTMDGKMGLLSLSDLTRLRRNQGSVVDNGDGTVTDTNTGLMWAAKDNGNPITWADAKKYCENYMGAGYTDWRMPTLDELEALYGEELENSKGFHISSAIELTDCVVWASDLRDEDAGAYRFHVGKRRFPPRTFTYYLRALPVRDPEGNTDKKKEKEEKDEVQVIQAASTKSFMTYEQISGLWDIKVKLEDGGGGILEFEFEVKNGILTGLYSGSQSKGQLEGYVKNNIIRWEFVAGESQTQIVYMGEILEDSTISGWAEYECCGPGVFTASKQK